MCSCSCLVRSRLFFCLLFWSFCVSSLFFLFISLFIFFFFFFSSRRRHTRLVIDWSSDVCSSDLVAGREHRLILLDQGLDVWSQFVVVDHRDIPGPNVVALIEQDQPVLAAGYVRHVYEPVLLLAHPSRDAVRRAVRAVDVVIAPESPALDFRTAPAPAPAPDQIQYGSDNVLKHLQIVKGDVERALAQAPVVVSGTYETGAQEHVYLETQGMIAYLEGDVLVVKGSMQCPYYVLKALQQALARDETRVRVIQTPTGGGFGGKEEFPSHIALHAALLALKSGRPVKLIYDRGEDMAATTKRHPARVRHRTGLSRDGRLLAQDIEVVIDGGAYVTLSPVVQIGRAHV